MVLAYLGYLQMGGAPVMDMEVHDTLVDSAPEGESPGGRGSLGRVGQVGIGSIRQTRLFHTDETGRKDREIGFDELLYTEGEQWVITHPWMDLFLSGMNCRVTADRGETVVDSAFGQFSPGDARFSGNVVIHLSPTDANDPFELYVYLDDLSFIADNSMFTTAGSVRFVSRSAQLTGQGMDLLYDGARSRLELFRIKDLESLRLRSDQFTSLAEAREGGGGTAGADATAPEASVARVEATASADANDAARDHYECVFHRNVVITTPEQRVTAKDRLTIGNIFLSDSESEETAETPTSETVAATAGEGAIGEPNTVPYPSPAALDTSPSPSVALDAIPESFFDIVVTCDGGLVIAPKGSPSLAPDLSMVGLEAARSQRDANAPGEGAEPDPNPNRQVLVAHRIDFDVSTTDTTLTGPVNIAFALDPNDLTGRDPGAERMPVSISAQDSVRFFAAAKRLQLDGNCIVTVHKNEPNLAYEYRMTAPMVAVELSEEPNAVTGEKTIGLARFEASGGPVAVRAYRYLQDELIGWVALHSTRLDYEGDEKLFAVTGPGEIRLHNGQTPEEPIDPNEFSLRQPCFAFLTGFDLLTYSAQTNKIVADADDRQILLDYFPQIDGSYDQRHVQADAGRIEIALTQSEGGRTDLLSLTALEGIAYEDPVNRFNGDVLFYDHPQTLVTVNGNGRQSCSFNGASVDRIRMNLTTGATKAEVLGPSTIQIRP